MQAGFGYSPIIVRREGTRRRAVDDGRICLRKLFPDFWAAGRRPAGCSPMRTMSKVRRWPR